MRFQKGWLLFLLLLLLTGCAGEGNKEFLAPETQGTRDITVIRGIASDGALFVELDKQVNVTCTVGWEILGNEVTETGVGLMLEGFRMALQDAMDGLTTEEAWAEDMEDFVAETVKNTAAELSNEDILVRVEGLDVERVEDP